MNTTLKAQSSVVRQPTCQSKKSSIFVKYALAATLTLMPIKYTLATENQNATSKSITPHTTLVNDLKKTTIKSNSWAIEKATELAAMEYFDKLATGFCKNRVGGSSFDWQGVHTNLSRINMTEQKYSNNSEFWKFFENETSFWGIFGDYHEIRQNYGFGRYSQLLDLMHSYHYDWESARKAVGAIGLPGSVVDSEKKDLNDLVTKRTYLRFLPNSLQRKIIIAQINTYIKKELKSDIQVNESIFYALIGTVGDKIQRPNGAYTILVRLNWADISEKTGLTQYQSVCLLEYLSRHTFIKGQGTLLSGLEWKKEYNNRLSAAKSKRETNIVEKTLDQVLAPIGTLDALTFGMAGLLLFFGMVATLGYTGALGLSFLIAVCQRVLKFFKDF